MCCMLSLEDGVLSSTASLRLPFCCWCFLLYLRIKFNKIPNAQNNGITSQNNFQLGISLSRSFQNFPFWGLNEKWWPALLQHIPCSNSFSLFEPIRTERRASSEKNVVRKVSIEEKNNKPLDFFGTPCGRARDLSKISPRTLFLR